MPIKHTYSILCSNLALVVKIAIMVLIILLLAVACFYSVIHPLYLDLRKIIESSNYTVDAQELVNHPFLTLSALRESYVGFFEQIHWQSSFLWFILIFVGFKFFFTLPLLPATKVMYVKMSTGFDVGILNAFISTGFQNLLLAAVSSIVLSVVDMALSLGSLLLCYALLPAIGVFAFPICILLFFLLLTARMAIICQWLPEICASESKNIFKNLGNSLLFSFKKFRKNFLCLLLINVVIFAIVCGTMITSLGVIPIMMIPIYYVQYCIMTLTLNFSYHKSKYYIDNGSTIYTPTRLF